FFIVVIPFEENGRIGCSKPLQRRRGYWLFPHHPIHRLSLLFVLSLVEKRRNTKFQIQKNHIDAVKNGCRYFKRRFEAPLS
ncbi:hypothetical protein, partial [Gallibacterium anatis]|uniref:hypothetical protein n=1 Tax=Gallibacterium anatis TaxID=750 RepID=UPI003005BA65